ncbi:MAG: hypothetical protein QOD66_763 [Solirubrobacteraceae bacterium]|nr:hypothetical protein [Solirubrobacteraceae bacterium]
MTFVELRRRLIVGVVAVAAVLAGGTPSALAAAAPPAITLTSSARSIMAGQPLTLSGHVSGLPTATEVRLYKSAYPYPVAVPVGSTATAADGSFSFGVASDRNVRYRVVVPVTGASAQVAVSVVGRAIVKVRALPLGRAEVTILVFHPPDLHWARAPVQWWFAGGGARSYVSGPSARARPLGPNIAVLRTQIALPAGRFRFRACFGPQNARALADPVRVPGCSGLGYQGSGSLRVGFPGPAAIANAAGYLLQRGGRKAFAVVDSEGRLSGVHVHWTFPTASVVKAMLLVAYLRRLDARGQHQVDAYSNSFLYPMIHVSDNNAATQCWSIVGDSGLYGVARAAGMTDFSVSGLWGTALLSPADQAHYFFEMDSLIPHEFVGYARFLLSTIEASQSWGIPVIARPLGYQTFFKDGSEPTGLGQLVHQVDRLEGHHRQLAIAVMTDGDPTMQYGIDTIQGVAAALLR